jgi:hypothetical protein
MHTSITRTALALALGLAFGAAPATAMASSGHPQPALARTVIVSVVRGRVTVEQPSRHRFVRIVGSVALHVGGSVDASAGTAGVEIATPSRTWTAELSHGSAQVLQAASGVTTFKLTGALDCASAARSTKHKPRHRSLWVSDKGGPFVAQGSYVLAAARGTEWITTDECSETTVHVVRGTIAVKNLLTHQTATVTAGHSYTAAQVPPAHFTWTDPEPISNGGEFADVSCSPSGFCAAVNDNGDVVTSSSPAGGPSTWTTTSIVSDSGLVSISCPTAQFCAADDVLSGDVLVSSDPSGGAGAWQTIAIATGGTLGTVRCTSASFCVAVDAGGDVIVSTDPTGGAGAWQLAKVNPGETLDDVSCLGDALCVAAGSGLSTSTNPTGGASAWRSNSSVGGAAVSCPTTTLCVLPDDNGNVYTSTNPTGGPAAYKQTELIDRLHPFQPATGVSCVANGPCVVVGLSGDAVTTLDPTGGSSAWTAETIDSSTGLAGVSCASSDLCVAVDESGNALIGTR